MRISNPARQEHYAKLCAGYGNAAGLLYQNGFLTKGFTPDDGDDYSDDDDDQQREKLVSYQMNKKKNEK